MRSSRVQYMDFALSAQDGSRLDSPALPQKVIQARLGHATITETMDAYGHLFPTRKTRPRGLRRDFRGGSDGTGTEPGNVVTVPSQVSDQ
jgi:integrase